MMVLHQFNYLKIPIKDSQKDSFFFHLFVGCNKYFKGLETDFLNQLLDMNT